MNLMDIDQTKIQAVRPSKFKSNPNMQEKLVVECKNYIRKLFMFFNKVNDVQIEQYARQLIEDDFTGKEIIAACDQLRDLNKYPPSYGEIKAILVATSARNKESNTSKLDELMKRIHKEVDSFTAIKEEVVKVLPKEVYDKYINAYARKVFCIESSWEGIGPKFFERIAIKDLHYEMTIKMDKEIFNRAFKRGELEAKKSVTETEKDLRKKIKDLKYT